MGRGHQAVAGCVRVAGLHAVHGGVDVQQPVAVGLAHAVEGVFLLGVHPVVVRKLLDDARGQQRHVARGGIVLGRGQAGGVDEVRVLHADAACLGVHLLGKGLLAARDGFGQDDGRVIAGLDDQPVQQLFHRGGLARVHEHARADGLVGRLRDGRAGVHVQRAVAQRLENHIGRHQLRERGRLHPLVRCLAVEHRVGTHVEEEPRAAADVGRRQRLGHGHRGCQTQRGGQHQRRQALAQQSGQGSGHGMRRGHVDGNPHESGHFLQGTARIMPPDRVASPDAGQPRNKSAPDRPASVARTVLRDTCSQLEGAVSGGEGFRAARGGAPGWRCGGRRPGSCAGPPG